MRSVQISLGRSSLVPVIEDADGAAREARRPEPRGQAGIMLRILRNLLAGPRAAILPPFEGYPPGDVQGVQAEDWRRAVYETMAGVDPGARRRAFNRGRVTLLDMKWINIKEPWVWVV
jgi:hypothetical protein